MPGVFFRQPPIAVEVHVADAPRGHNRMQDGRDGKRQPVDQDRLEQMVASYPLKTVVLDGDKIVGPSARLWNVTELCAWK